MGVQTPPAHPPALDSPGPAGGHSSRSGPAWGTAPGAAEHALRRKSPGSHPRLRLRRSPPPRPGGARSPGSEDDFPELCSEVPPRGAGDSGGTPGDAAAARRAQRPAPRPPGFRPSSRGSPFAHTLPGPAGHSPRRPGLVRPPPPRPRPPAPPRAPRRESPGPRPLPPTPPESGTRRRW